MDFSAEIENSNGFFHSKTGHLQKKKRVFTEIETDFSAEIGNSNGFSAQKQVTSKKKKKKKKKRVFTEIVTDFLAEIENPHGSSCRITATTSQLRHPNTLGGLFQFFSKNRPQKKQKRTILHTLQTNGGGLDPPRPPPTLLTSLNKYKILFVFCTVISSRKLGLYDRKKIR